MEEERFCRFAWNDSGGLIIYYVIGISMINVAPLIVIVILYSRIMQALRKKSMQDPFLTQIQKAKDVTNCNTL